MNRVLVYTAITGDYEKPRTDIRVESLDLFKDPRRSARMHKCLTPDFHKYDYSIWVDGNTSLKVKPEELIAQLGDADILCYKHWKEDIYEEAKDIIGLGLDDRDVVTEQMKRYKAMGFPEGTGLSVGTYIIRRHTPRVENFNNLWWAEMCRGSKRDQLSFDYAAWRAGVTIKWFGETHFDIHKVNTNFNYKTHGNEV